VGYLVEYCVHQRSGVKSGYLDELFGPQYVGTLYGQQEEGIDTFLAGIFRALEPPGKRGPRDIYRQVQNTGAKILGEIGAMQLVTLRAEFLQLDFLANNRCNIGASDCTTLVNLGMMQPSRVI